MVEMHQRKSTGLIAGSQLSFLFLKSIFRGIFSLTKEASSRGKLEPLAGFPVNPFGTQSSFLY